MYDTRRPGLVTILNSVSIFIIMIYVPLHILFFEILWENNGTWQEWYVKLFPLCTIIRKNGI